MALSLCAWLPAGARSRRTAPPSSTQSKAPLTGRKRATSPPSAVAAGPNAAAVQLCLVWPFENRSGNSSLDWIGESFVIELQQQMSGGPLEFVSREQRWAAMKIIGAPPEADLSHATLVELGQQAGARWLISGWFDDEGGQFRAGAWVVDLQREHLETVLPQTGAMEDLEQVQRRLAWAIEQEMGPEVKSEVKSEAKGEVTSTADADAALPALPLAAYESFVRAQMAATQAVKLKELQVAVHFAPHDPRVEEALGEAYLEGGDNENALYWLAQVPEKSSLRPEAQFWAAVGEYRLAGYSRAAQMFGDLELQYPLPSVTANLALAKAQSEHPVSPPPKLQTEFPIASFQQLRREIAKVQAAKVAELPPDQQAQQEVEAGQRLQAQGGLDAAAIAFQKAAAVAQNPHWISAAHAGLAEIWLKRHNATQAQAELRQALAADADNPQALEVQRQLHASTPHAATAAQSPAQAH